MSNQHTGGSIWPEPRVAYLQALVEGGIFSYAEIAQTMGVSKNAVIGKARRMGFEGPRSVGIRGGPPSTMLERLDALDLFPKASACVFPIGEPGHAGFHFCGDAAIEGKAYCALHYKLTFKPNASAGD